MYRKIENKNKKEHKKREKAFQDIADVMILGSFSYCKKARAPIQVFKIATIKLNKKRNNLIVILFC